MLESEIKTKCRKALEKAGWCVIHLIQTNQNGIPDTLALRNARALFIEFKRPGKKPELLQLYRHEKLRKQGFDVRVVRDLTEINDLL